MNSLGKPVHFIIKDKWFASMGLKMILLGIILGIGIIALMLLGSASADTHWWDGEGADALWSNDLNWNSTAGNDIEPIAGDDIYYWDWDKSCTWDVAITVGDITISANYTGTVTQGAVDFGYSDFSMAGGVWTGVTTKTQTNAGNFVHSGGTITASVLNLIKSVNSNLDTDDQQLRTLTINAGVTVTLTSNLALYGGGGGADVTKLELAAGAVLDINTRTLTFYSITGAATFTWTNAGTITGTTGTINFQMGANRTYTLGTVNAKFLLVRYGSAPTLTLGDSFVCGNTVTITGGGAGAEMTLDLAGKSLSATSITAGVRGVIMSSVAGARIDADSIIVQTNGHIYGVNILGIIYSDPTLTVNNPNLYSYSATSNLTVKTWAFDSGNASWISVGSSNGTVYGTPPSVGYGHPEYFTVNLNLTDYTGDKFYQNYTITVYNLILTPPTITSTPILTVEQTFLYSYTLTANQTGTWNFTSNATWLSLVGNVLFGTDNNNGSYWVKITIINVNGTGYQNYTLTVTAYISIIGPSDWTMILSIFILGLFSAFAFVDKRIMFLTAIVWMIVGMTILNYYGTFWILLSIGTGMYFLLMGVSHYVVGE